MIPLHQRGLVASTPPEGRPFAQDQMDSGRLLDRLHGRWQFADDVCPLEHAFPSRAVEMALEPLRAL